VLADDRVSDADRREDIFASSGDGGGRMPEHVPFGGLRFALWLAAYVLLGLLLAMFVQSLLNWEKHEREGLDPPDVYPHPDDFIINEATGEVTIDGPTTKDEAGAESRSTASA
jgi:hypothetical protein